MLVGDQCLIEEDHAIQLLQAQNPKLMSPTNWRSTDLKPLKPRSLKNHVFFHKGQMRNRLGNLYLRMLVKPSFRFLNGFPVYCSLNVNYASVIPALFPAFMSLFIPSLFPTWFPPSSSIPIYTHVSARFPHHVSHHVNLSLWKPPRFFRRGVCHCNRGTTFKSTLRVTWWKTGCNGCLINHYMGVSKNRGTPKWMVYSGKPY